MHGRWRATSEERQTVREILARPVAVTQPSESQKAHDIPQMATTNKCCEKPDNYTKCVAQLLPSLLQVEAVLIDAGSATMLSAA